MAEEEVIEEQSEENEGVVMPSLDPEPEKVSIANAPEPEKEELFEVTLDGKKEAVSRNEYDYLAKLGAQSIMAAQYQQYHDQQSQQFAETDTADQPIDMPQATPDSEAANRLNQRIGNLESQLQEQKVQTATRDISTLIDTKVEESPVFKGVKTIDGDTDMELEVKKEIYNLSVAERIPVDKAFNKVEAKWSKIMGQDRSAFLLNKLRQQESSPPATGGTQSSPRQPSGAKEWTNGQLLQSITERLLNQQS
tara:strand:+ start:6779 stop:7531 length:753 start_codon:yes stop_codon:yes gene_type:complete